MIALTLGIHIFKYFLFCKKDFILVGLTFIGDVSLPHLDYSKMGSIPYVILITYKNGKVSLAEGTLPNLIP